MKKTHWRKQLLFSSLAITLVFIPTVFLPGIARASVTENTDNDPCLVNNGAGDAVITSVTSVVAGPLTVVSVPVINLTEASQLNRSLSIQCAAKKAAAAVKEKTVGITFFGIPVPYTSWDAILKGLMKIVINKLTDSTVKWINTGFNGNPQYITDPGRYFGDIANGFTGDFLSQVAGGNLCSPFKPQIVLSLQQSSRGTYNPQCTLTGIGNNLENFYSNFSEGGWKSWFSMTQNSSNNPYDAYLEAKTNLDQGIANKTGLATLEANWNKGFLSTKTCTKTFQEAADERARAEGRDPSILSIGLNGEAIDPNGCDGTNGSEMGPVKTPGSVIESQLNQILGQGTTDLGLARSFDDIVSALVGALTKKVFNSASGLFSGGGTDYSSSGTQGNAENGYNPGTVNTGSGTNPTSGISCAPSKNNAVFGEPIIWAVTAIDSPGLSYSYQWSGDEVPDNSNGSTLVISYTSEKNKTASVIVTATRTLDASSAPIIQTSTINCSPAVMVAKYAPLVINSCTATSGEALANEISPFEIDTTGERRIKMARVTWVANVSGGSGIWAVNKPIIWEGESRDEFRNIIQTREFGSPTKKMDVPMWTPFFSWSGGTSGHYSYVGGSNGTTQTITKNPDGSTTISISRLYEILNAETTRDVSAKITVRDSDVHIQSNGVASLGCKPAVFIYKP